MDSNHEVVDGRGPSLRKRSMGVAIVASIYAAQLITLAAIRGPLQQSVLLVIIAPIILGVGWLSSGLILGGMVLSRSSGGWRFFYGLALALFLSFLLVIGILEFLNRLPPTYNGP
jgi:hypothetical protein